MFRNTAPVGETGRVALPAVQVVVRFDEVYGLFGFLEGHLFVAAEVILVDVPHAASLGHRIAVHSIVRMTDVAALATEEGIARMAGGERLRCWVVAVFEVRAHHMTRAAKRTLRRSLHAGYGRRNCSDRGKDSEPEQQPQLGPEVERRFFDQVVDENGRRYSRSGQRHDLEPRRLHVVQHTAGASARSIGRSETRGGLSP